MHERAEAGSCVLYIYFFGMVGAVFAMVRSFDLERVDEMGMSAWDVFLLGMQVWLVE